MWRGKTGDKSHKVAEEDKKEYRTDKREERFAPVVADIVIHQFPYRVNHHFDKVLDAPWNETQGTPDDESSDD